MSSRRASKGEERRSSTQNVKPFSRLDSSSGIKSPSRSRASTLSNEIRLPETPTEKTSVFEVGAGEDDLESAAKSSALETSPAPPTDVEIPVEILSFTDKFIKSLTSSKVYPAPLNVEQLSELYQQFYEDAERHINTHIETKAVTRNASFGTNNRGVSPAKSIASVLSHRSTSSNDQERQTGQQMLTPGEVAEKRRFRFMLDQKRIALEEAVERRACEALYHKLWRHKSSLDEVSDQKLRSKTAAMALMDIGLKELGVDISRSQDAEENEQLEAQIAEFVLTARTQLSEMNEAHHPAGKIQALASAHQTIVELLTQIHQSSSSADEILPVLIYTLTTIPPSDLNVVSDLHFIQLFRDANKMNGEAAYCLVNLEAAVTFLNEIDTSTLQKEVEQASPLHPKPMSSQPLKSLPIPMPASPTTSNPLRTPLTALLPVPSDNLNGPESPSRLRRPSSPLTPVQIQRLSNLLQTPAQAVESATTAIGSASDAVRSSADQGFRNISATLDNSFKLLFGKLTEQKVVNVEDKSSKTVITVPKTLDDARRLISPRVVPGEHDGAPSPPLDGEFTSKPPVHATPIPTSNPVSITGKTPARVRAKTAINVNVTSAPQSSQLSTSPDLATSAIESMRSLGNSLNPLGRFSVMPSMNPLRGFGRSSSSSSVPKVEPLIPASNAVDKKVETSIPEGDESVLSALQGIEPPIQKFLDIDTVADLRMGDVQLLLLDYQRLARDLAKASQGANVAKE